MACFSGPSAPALRRGPQVVDLFSDSDDEQPAQGSPAVGSPAVDGHVAQLVDMGFTPEQAAQVSGALPCMQVSVQPGPVLYKEATFGHGTWFSTGFRTQEKGSQSACHW